MKNKIELKTSDVIHIHEEIYGRECSLLFSKQILDRYNILKSYKNSYSIYSFLKNAGPEKVDEVGV